tara:strand:- start:1406 stop:2395 length:990 start_codon:yes stop_codon:yes gene_type:complete
MVFNGVFSYVLLGILSLAALVLSANLVMKKAMKLAKHFGLSQTFIGLTIFSIGTSIPEIATTLIAGVEILRGKLSSAVLSGTALGTTIGSDNIQITLVVGLVALFGTLKASKKFMKFDYLIMAGVSIIVFVMALNFHISRLEGIILVLGYLVYLGYLWKKEKKHRKKKRKVMYGNKSLIAIDSFIIVLGIGLILAAAEFVFLSTVFFVDTFNVSGSLIGVVVVGVATALPELTTSVIAAIRKASNISLGILIGSNTTNMSLALGLGAALSGYEVSKSILYYDLVSRLVLPLIVGVLFWKGKITKKEAIFLILLYIAYIGLRIIFFPTDV